MKRRHLLGLGAGLVIPLSGCLGSAPGGADSNGSGADPATTFELVDPELPAADPPDVAVDGDTVTVRGTVQYGSSSCGTVELAHLGYEDSQDRLDVLVVAADAPDAGDECTDDLVTSGYRLETAVSGRLRRVAATEHHVFGETYSTTTDLTDY